MTSKQKKLYDFVRFYTGNNGYSPSYEDMMKHLGLRSKSGVHRLIQSLTRQGKLKSKKGCARTVEIVSDANFERWFHDRYGEPETHPIHFSRALKREMKAAFERRLV